jgi:hypothetical protein
MLKACCTPALRAGSILKHAQHALPACPAGRKHSQNALPVQDAFLAFSQGREALSKTGKA